MPVSQPPIPSLPQRKLESHKGDYGRAVIVGGSRGMSGAVALAGRATLRGGAGLVTLAVPEVCLETVAAFEPCYMSAPLPCDEEGCLAAVAREPLYELCRRADVLACGPGLGRTAEITELVGWLYRTVTIPMVVDADGLNALAAKPDSMCRPAGPRILTPHPGEFQRLLSAIGVDSSSPSAARELADHCQAVVVLKGHRTLIVDARRQAINQTGNPGMATGGAGDVLTGVISALLCQGLDAYDAAQLGVHVHGLSGDLAAEALGQVSLIASDLIQFLPQAFRQLEKTP